MSVVLIDITNTDSVFGEMIISYVRVKHMINVSFDFTANFYYLSYLILCLATMDGAKSLQWSSLSL